MSVRPRLLPVLAALALGACASTGRARSFESPLGFRQDIAMEEVPEAPLHRTEVRFPVDRVAEELPAVYRYLGLEAPTEGGAEPYTYFTPSMRITGSLYEGEPNSDYIDCGADMQGERADVFQVEFAMATRLRPRDDGTTVVETRLEGRARDRFVNENPVFCRGTGRLEEEIGQLLRQGGVR